MAKKQQHQEKPPVDQGAWGDNVVQAVVPSGVPLRLEVDSDCILRFEGKKDISDKVLDEKGEPQPPGSVVYLTFNDGKRFVSLSVCYALGTFAEKDPKDGGPEPNVWYYIHHQGEVETKLNPMKDLEIRRLGRTGEEIQCPTRVSDDGKLRLASHIIAEINYNRLNYPLRGRRG